jgi:hypothetical protein
MDADPKSPLQERRSPAFHEATCSALVDFLVAETSEDAVFCFISAISCFGITDREDAIAAMEKDADTRKWAVTTATLIPEPYVQNVEWWHRRDQAPIQQTT